MLINLWSTPRTGSNWYSQYLFKKYSSENSRTKLYAQYLNSYHLINYFKPNSSDYVYSYEKNCYYKHYIFDGLFGAITHTMKYGARTLDSEYEQDYRIKLLYRHNHNKNPSIFYSHIAPMSDIAYKTLFDMADKNIFLYRKDIKRQISSYCLAYGTTQYKPILNQPIYENVEVSYDVIKNLVDRIVKWHRLDKTGCETICYEDLDFESFTENTHKKQNELDPFIQLSQTTQDSILELINYCNEQLKEVA